MSADDERSPSSGAARRRGGLPGSGPALVRLSSRSFDAVGTASSSTSRCCWSLLGSRHRRRLLLGAPSPSPSWSPASSRWSARPATTSSARGIARTIIGKKEREVRPLAGLAVLLRLDHEPVVDHPARQFPVTSRSRSRRSSPRSSTSLWVYLTFKQHGFVGGFKNMTVPTGAAARSTARWSCRSSSSRTCGPAVHPRGPTLREHVRRPHAAGVVHDRQLVPARSGIGSVLRRRARS